ncbi:ThuA domain-containing protein [Subtercola sp. YIM 133946]|uniref:ThuA domain-containing protein n=1 Tax=Subtercola sp. YIM 133946 TaxID=3118909 RepID=UPI002F950EBD
MTSQALIRVLIASGHMSREHHNEHRSFRLHNQLVTTLLESTGRFSVRVMEDFRGVGPEIIDRYDLIFVIFEGRDDYFDVATGFGANTDTALIEAVRASGKGIVWFHGSSVQEPEWGYPEEYEQMRGARFAAAYGLRPRPNGGEVLVHTTEPRHAITAGIAESWTVHNDDILMGAQLLPGAQTLLTIFDDVETYVEAGWPKAHTPVTVPPGGLKDLPGIDQHQAVAWINEWGAGRSFTITLGHDHDTFRKSEFMTVLVRGSEWAATGSVTLGPADRSGERRWRIWPYYGDNAARPLGN